MTDTPKRIRAWETKDCNGQWTVAEVGGVEYVRADLEATASPSIATPLDDPRVVAARECLERIQDYAGDGMLDFIEGLAADALAALDKPKE